MELKQGVMLVFLGLNALRDLKKKEISLLSVIVFGIAGLIWGIADHSLGIKNLIPEATGVLFLLLSIFTGGKIGMGDVWILLAAGILISPGEYTVMLLLGLLMASLWAGYLLVVRKKKRNAEIPFLPFLFLGYLGGVFIC